MNGLRATVLLAVLAALSGPAAGQNDSPPREAERFADAFLKGDPGLEFRLRHEFVDDDAFQRDGNALTLRTRINFRTMPWRGLQLFAEGDNVTDLGVDNFNGGSGSTPGRERFPVIADAGDTRLNQLYLDIRPGRGVRIRGGRQRIQHDDDRFVGNVGWRQNEQTFDAAGLVWEGVGGLRLEYDYVFDVNRIFGGDIPAADHNHDTHLVNLAWTPAPGHKLVGYFYNIDNRSLPAFSSRSTGIRYQGRVPLGGDRSAGWLAEYAHQTDITNNPVDFDADYWRLEPSFTLHPLLTVFGGAEVLTGDNRSGGAFRTPLATLHAFNGYADQFLATPDRGLRDFFAGYSGGIGRLSWRIVWHSFEAQTGGADFGNELDAVFNVGITDGIGLLLKVAVFDEDSRAPAGFRDVTKFWAQLSARF